jgi:protein-S-isoprenylcysteine O-methyltransferase Ste14
MSVTSLLLTIALWTVFGLQHSVLAQGFVKSAAGRWFGQDFVDYGYRFVYFLSQCFVYPAFWYIVSHFESGNVLWTLPSALNALHFALKLTGHFLIVATFIAADVNTFVGTKQLWAYVRAKLKRKPVDPVAVFGQSNFVVGFPFTIVRHPMYLGIILSLLTTTGIYTEKVVLNLICLLFYVEVGAHFEERQLVRLFGDAYRQYQTTTSKYLPVSWLRQFLRPRVLPASSR